MRKKTAAEIPFYQLLPARAVANRYNVHLRSVSRWVARGVIPPPDQIICDRRYWYETTLDQADRERTIAAAKAASTPKAGKVKVRSQAEAATD